MITYLTEKLKMIMCNHDIQITKQNVTKDMSTFTDSYYRFKECPKITIVCKKCGYFKTKWV